MVNIEPRAATLHHIGLVVPDLEAAMAELTQLLGLRWTQPQQRPDGERTLRVAFSTSEPRIELIQGNPDGTWSTRGGARLDHMAFWIEDADATEAKVTELGLDREAGGTASWGGRWTYVRTQAVGARIELCDARGQEPFARTWGFDR